MEWNDLTERCEQHRRAKLQVKREAQHVKYLKGLEKKRKHRASIRQIEEFKRIMKEIDNGKTDSEAKEGPAIEHVRSSVAAGVPDSGQGARPCST